MPITSAISIRPVMLSTEASKTSARINGSRILRNIVYVDQDEGEILKVWTDALTKRKK